MTTSMNTREALGAEIRALLDRISESDVPDQVVLRGRELAALLGEAAEETASRAGEAWRESAPLRRDAERSARTYGRNAARWGRRTWRTSIQPAIRNAWRRRTLAYSAAGAALPASRELINKASTQITGRPQPDRHWAAFFFGLVAGAIAGAAVALLTAPQKGETTRAEIAVRARDAAVNANEWRAMFQRADALPEAAPSETE